MATSDPSPDSSTPAPRDAYGSLDRDPAPPARGFCVLLRRAVETATGQDTRIAARKRALVVAETTVEEATAEADRVLAQRRLTAATNSLRYEQRKRALTTKRLACLIETVDTRTRANPHTKRHLTGSQIDALLGRAQMLVDLHTVRTRQAGSDGAFARLAKEATKSARRLLWMAVRSRQVDEEEAQQRQAIALLGAIDSYDPGTGAALATHAYWRIMRSLQLRTAAERQIGHHQKEDGSWTAPATTLSTFTDEAGEQYEPVMLPAHLRRRATLSDEPAAFHGDVVRALARLTEQDRVLAQAMFVDGMTVPEACQHFGMDSREVKKRRTAIRVALRRDLASYAAS